MRRRRPRAPTARTRHRARPAAGCAAAGSTRRSRPLPRGSRRRRERGTCRGVAGAVGGALERRRLLGAAHLDLRTPGRVRLQVGDEGVELGRGFRAGHDAHRDLRARLRDQDVGGGGDVGHVDADRVDRRLGPELVADPAGAGEVDAVEHVGAAAEVVGAEVLAGPGAARDALDGHVALVVVQGGQELARAPSSRRVPARRTRPSAAGGRACAPSRRRRRRRAVRW